MNLDSLQKSHLKLEVSQRNISSHPVDKGNNFGILSKQINISPIVRKYGYFLLVGILIVTLIIVFGIYRTWEFGIHEDIQQSTGIEVSQLHLTNSTPVPTPVFVPNPINGMLMPDNEYNLIKDRPFLAVIIQNNVVARPPSGLNEADIVYETLVEGNITRFLAIFWSKDADRIQSIRSTRHYFVNLLGDYNNPAFMHIGYAYCTAGDHCDSRTDSLVLMQRYGIRRLSDAVDSVTKELSFSRDKNCEMIKASEHCAYSSTQRLWSIAEQKGWKNDLSQYRSWLFTDGTTEGGNELRSFLVHFNGYNNVHDTKYSVIWKYNAEKNTYERYNFDNSAYIDSNNEQVSANVIIYQQITSIPTGDSKAHQYQEVIGNGIGYVMQSGKVYPIKWSKPDFNTKTIFTDATTGKEFVFNRGKIWVMLVPKGYDYISLDADE